MGLEVWEMREHDTHGETTPMMLDREAPDESTRRDETLVTVTHGNPMFTEEATGRRLADLNMGERRLANGPRTVGVANGDDNSSEHADSDNGRHGLMAFNHNRYATRKTAAQGMMDMALMLANASQLKSVLQEGKSHDHYTLLLFLISMSIILQIFTGIILLIVGARESNFEDDDEKRNKKTNKLNNFSVGLVFLITVTNIFITSFGINGNTSSLLASGHGSGGSNGEISGTGTGSADTELPGSDT